MSVPAPSPTGPHGSQREILMDLHNVLQANAERLVRISPDDPNAYKLYSNFHKEFDREVYPLVKKLISLNPNLNKLNDQVKQWHDQMNNFLNILKKTKNKRTTGQEMGILDEYRELLENYGKIEWMIKSEIG